MKKNNTFTVSYSITIDGLVEVEAETRAEAMFKFGSIDLDDLPKNQIEDVQVLDISKNITTTQESDNEPEG